MNERKDPFVEAQKKIDAESNEWRTLREILEEGHKLPARITKDGFPSEVYWLIGKNRNGVPVINHEDRGYKSEPGNDQNWRIYEPPKEKKKWAPALIYFGRIHQPMLTQELYYSKEHAQKSRFAHKNRLIWPAPGFTPVELPE